MLCQARLKQQASQYCSCWRAGLKREILVKLQFKNLCLSVDSRGAGCFRCICSREVRTAGSTAAGAGGWGSIRDPRELGCSVLHKPCYHCLIRKVCTESFIFWQYRSVGWLIMAIGNTVLFSSSMLGNRYISTYIIWSTSDLRIQSMISHWLLFWVHL